MICKGCAFHIVRVNDVESKISSLESVPVVNEFLKVFHDDFSVFLPNEK